MKKILQEFKQFAMRGNVIDMAVGIIIVKSYHLSSVTSSCLLSAC